MYKKNFYVLTYRASAVNDGCHCGQGFAGSSEQDNELKQF